MKGRQEEGRKLRRVSWVACPVKCVWRIKWQPQPGARAQGPAWTTWWMGKLIGGKKQSISPYVQNNSQTWPKQGKKGFKGQEPVAIDVGSSGGKAEGEMETWGREEKRSTTDKHLYILKPIGRSQHRIKSVLSGIMAARRNLEFQVTAVRWERCSKHSVMFTEEQAPPGNSQAVGKGERLFSLGKLLPACFLLKASSLAQSPFLHPEVDRTDKSLQRYFPKGISTFSGSHLSIASPPFSGLNDTLFQDSA